MTKEMSEPRVSRELLTCGVVGPVIFIVVFLIAGAFREDYDPMRHPVSSLALGGSGWIQVANFIITGTLLIAFAVGLRPAMRRFGAGIWAPLLVGLVGVGLIGAGVFVTDPVSGYPPGTPLIPVGTTAGALHDLLSMPVFLGLPAACLVVAYRAAKTGSRGFAAYSAVTAVVFLTGFVLTSVGFTQNLTFAPIGGLLQRLTLVIGFGWLVALAARLIRRLPEPLDPEPIETPTGTVD
jgi:hypothetical membrane protein